MDQVDLVHMVQMNVAEAKAKLSQLIDQAESGADVVIARAGRPAVRLVAVDDVPPRELGFLALEVGDDLFAPLAEDELERWE